VYPNSFPGSLARKQKKGEQEFINHSASTKCNSPLGSASESSQESSPIYQNKNPKKNNTSKYQVSSKDKATTVTKQIQVVRQSITVNPKNTMNSHGKRNPQFEDVGDSSPVVLDVTKKQKLHNQKAKIVPKEQLQSPKSPAILTPFSPLAGSNKELTSLVALDCEMVMVDRCIHELARCSIVDYNGHVLFDEMIKPKGRITNYLTWVSGITPAHLKHAKPFEDYKEEILEILKGRTIVGHSLKHDFEVLNFFTPEKNTRDLAHFKLLKKEGKILSLKKMVSEHLDTEIQNGQHDSVEDARSAMAIYRKFEKEWEEQIKHSNYGMVRTQLLDDLKMFTQK